MSEASATQASVPAPLTGDELTLALKNQLAWYFSPSNLARDHHLVSQMDSQGYVAIANIASFKRVLSLSSDIALITKTMKECPTLQVDDSGLNVRASQKPRRTTLILRNIPSELPEREVKAFFDFPDCPMPVTFKPEYGNTWFVTFTSEQDVEKADLALKSGRTYNDKPISCHIKSERGFVQQPAFFPSNAPWVQAESFYPRNTNYYPYANTRNYDSKRGGRDRHTEHTKGKITGGPKSARGDKPKSARKGKKDSKGKEFPEPNFGPSTFPPLPSARKADIEIKFSREEMHAIVEACIEKGAPRPTTFPAYIANGFTRDSQLKKCELNDSFPVIFPASPSPELAAQAHSSTAMETMPFLDLEAYMPSVEDPSTHVPMNQANVAKELGLAQGIQVTDTAAPQQHQKRRSRANSSVTSSAPHAAPAVSAPVKKPVAAEPVDEFKVVTNRRNKGGHGHGNARARSPGGHGGRGGHGGERPPRERGHGGDRGGRGGHGPNSRPRNNPPRSKECTAESKPVSNEPKKPTAADLVKLAEEKSKQAQPAETKKVPASATKPAPKKQDKQTRQGGRGKPQQNVSAEKKPEKDVETPAAPKPEAKPAAETPAVAPEVNGKKSFADLLKPKPANTEESS